MPQYAQFDSTAGGPAPVIGWYDTDEFTYPNLPAAVNLLELTAAQWEARLTNPSGWAVFAGMLVPYTPPVPVLTFAQQAAAAMSAGLTLTLSGSLALPATAFPTDPTTQTKLAAVITTINTTGAFPGGATSYPLKDASGAWHTLTLAQYKSVAAAIAGYAAALDLIIDGNPLGATALPPASASLTLT